MGPSYLKGTTMPLAKKIDLISLGNTIVDMEYQVNESTLTDLGIKKGSMTLIDQETRDQLRSLLGDTVHLCNGGSVANSVFVAKQFGLTVHHLGVVGTDSLSRFVFDDYKACGIHESFHQTQVDGQTACCTVLITPDGERTMLTYLGVSNQFASAEPFLSLLSDAKILFIEGYLLADDHCFELIKTMILFAKNHGTKVAFSLSNADLISFFKDRFNALINMKLDFLFGNFQEATTLAKSKKIENIKSFFSPLTKETIITDGANGAYIIDSNDVTHCPTIPTTPVDTTGAGDAFAGTYLAKKLHQCSIESSAKKANEISSLVVSNFGARPQALLNNSL